MPPRARICCIRKNKEKERISLAESIKGLGDKFLKGINVHAPESREFAQEQIKFLRQTPIEWVRIHPLPTRRLRDRGRSGVSYLDAIEEFAKAGFNLIIPIDVGVKENVGVITVANIRRFVDESYNEAFKAVKRIENRVNKYRSKIIYGVENELDTKEWILQSLPNVGWRESTLAWLEFSADSDLKYKRLGYILEGINEASPNALTMINFEADDPGDHISLTMSFLLAAQTVLSKLGIIEKNARLRMNNFMIDVYEAISRLKHIDIIGLDNYPNYLTKLPPKGEDIGGKVNEIAHSTKKPVINVEFGYTTTGVPLRQVDVTTDVMSYGRDKNMYREPTMQSTEELQRRFYANALTSIENSSSQGTFPWVLMLDPRKPRRPREEQGFTLIKTEPNRSSFQPVRALKHYITWLENIRTRESSVTDNDLGEQVGANSG